MENQNNNTKKFSFFSLPISNTKPSKVFTLLDAYNYIVGHQATHSTNSLRAIADKTYARQYKARNFNYCTFSGTFNKRSDDGLIHHSGLLCLDFDHLNNIEDVKDILIHDEYFETQLLFVSPSGDGLKWIVEIDTTEASHQDWFDSISNYLSHTYSLVADPQCRNISRACFLPHDPHCIINPKFLRHDKETI